MWYGLLSIVVSILLIFTEFFVPGGILGSLGILLFIAGVVLTFLDASSLPIALLVNAVYLFILIGMISLALKRIQKGKGNICSHGDQEGFVASEVDKSLIEVHGEASSDLKPSGYILIQGRRLQAVSAMGYITKGTPIKVINTEGARYIVKKIEKE
jgi:membrane-bound ClpP family serine protease